MPSSSLFSRENSASADAFMSLLNVAAASAPGLLRHNHQGAAYAGSRLLAVADGRGGHAGDEIASQIAIDAVADPVRLSGWRP